MQILRVLTGHELEWKSLSCNQTQIILFPIYIPIYSLHITQLLTVKSIISLWPYGLICPILPLLKGFSFIIMLRFFSSCAWGYWISVSYKDDLCLSMNFFYVMHLYLRKLELVSRENLLLVFYDSFFPIQNQGKT